MTFANANTRTGETYLNAATVALGNNSGLGTGILYQVKDSAATLDLNGYAISNALRLHGTGVGGLGALING
ncbi:MAG: hypothetical protein JZU63_08960, partial [Rhodoferax sp.]|nr:hypothetical protein [Rhodoferax sp.]